MKLKLREFVDGDRALSALGAIDMPVSTAYKIAKNLRLIQLETQPYYDVRKKKLEPLADKKGKVEYPDAETRKKIEGEFDKLLDQEADVAIKALPIKALGDIEVAPAILYGAWFMFTD